MKIRYLLVAAVLGSMLFAATPAAAAPACVMAPWHNGQSCTFEAPAGAFVFGGVATASEGQFAWIAVQVEFNGFVIASCYGQGTGGAACEGMGQAFAPSFTHVCRVFGTGGPKAHCADPPLLPLNLG